MNRKSEISTFVENYIESENEFIPGETYIAPSGTITDKSEVINVIDAALNKWKSNRWATHYRYLPKFEARMKEMLGVAYARFCNSGSSANLLAISTLRSNFLKNSLSRHDRVITVAAGFPTTINPIIQNELVPIFLDVDLHTANIDTVLLERALQYDPKAIMLAHTLGNPWDIDTVLEFAREHNLYVIEDCCDALGSIWDGQHVGTYGDMSTMSFYPAHHITTAHGGMVFTDSAEYEKIMRSMRDWGRSCWCPPSISNTCGMRFGQQFGDLPFGYDHKYVYTEIGYNLQATELQAAIGVAQLDKVYDIIEARRRNWRLLREQLPEEYFIFQKPLEKANPSWFGFLITLRDGIPFTRDELVHYLEDHQIGTRLLFAGNAIRQPAYKSVPYLQISTLDASDKIMNDSFWIGVHPRITKEMIGYILSVFDDFINENT